MVILIAGRHDKEGLKHTRRCQRWARQRKPPYRSANEDVAATNPRSRGTAWSPIPTNIQQAARQKSAKNVSTTGKNEQPKGPPRKKEDPIQKKRYSGRYWFIGAFSENQFRNQSAFKVRSWEFPCGRVDDGAFNYSF